MIAGTTNILNCVGMFRCYETKSCMYVWIFSRIFADYIIVKAGILSSNINFICFLKNYLFGHMVEFATFSPEFIIIFIIIAMIAMTAA